MKSSPIVSIVVLNWNGKSHTLKCLASLMKARFASFEVLLVDNGSTDGTAEAVRVKFPKVRLIQNKNDLGFCKGNNQAVKHAKGKYILLLNNDTIVSPTFLTYLVNRIESDDSIGIVQPKILMYGSKLLQSGCAFFTQTGILYYYGYNKNPSLKKYNDSRRMYSANGACMLIRRTVIDQVELFDEDFFAYFEETDFCHRAQLAGYSVWYEPKSVIEHIGGVDNSKTPSHVLQYHSYKNRLTSYLKNLGTLQLSIVLPIYFVLSIFSAAIFAFRNSPNVGFAILSAFVYNIRTLPHTLSKRARIQRYIRTVSDTEIFRQTMHNPSLRYYKALFTDLSTYEDTYLE